MRSPQWQDLDEAGRKEFWASLALRHCRGIGPRTQAALVKRFGSAYQALQQLDQWRMAGKRSLIAAEMASGSWRTTARREWDAAARLSAGIDDVAHRYAVEHDGYDDAVENIVVGYGVAHPVLYLGGRRDGCQPCEYEGDDEPCELNG